MKANSGLVVRGCFVLTTPATTQENRASGSGYEVELSIGIRYTFGSLFNNVVNPRFGD